MSSIRNIDKITERELADVVDFKLNYLANNKLSQNMTVNGNVGAFKDGQTLVKGTRVHDVIQGILNDDFEIPYKLPTLEITGTNPYAEVGDTIPISIIPVFTQNDAGPLNRFVLEKSVSGGNYEVIFDSDMIQVYSGADLSIIDSPDILSFRATVWFDEGEVKYENGEPIDGHIEAGSISTELTISGVRKCFYGAEPGVTFPVTTSDQVRALPESTVFGVETGGTLQIKIPAGTTRITLAYPSYIKDIEKIVSKKLGYDVKEVFEKSLVRVKGLNGYSDIHYKVYTYIPDTSYPSDDIYTFYLLDETETITPIDESQLVDIKEINEKLLNVEDKMKRAVFIKE